MASESDVEATQAFPNPPFVLYSLYTDENVKSGTAPKPPVPVQGTYNMFGNPFNVRTLQSMSSVLLVSVLF